MISGDLRDKISYESMDVDEQWYLGKSNILWSFKLLGDTPMK